MTIDDLPEDARSFLLGHFPDGYEHDPTRLSDDEFAEVEALIDATAASLHDNVGKLGMAFDFLIVAEELSQVDDWSAGYRPDLTADDITDHYETKDTNTLTIRYDGEQYGIRPVQNEVRDLFIYELRRTNFPSSPGHHTGNWPDYAELLDYAFRLSRTGRFEACLRLFDLGLEELEEKRFESRDPAFRRPFTDIVSDYQRSHPDENGGLAFQAMAYGYVKAEYPHLSIRASKVRTGSSRQNRYGDIDGFQGPDLMVSVEVKDLDIDDGNYRSELGTTIQLAESTTAVPVAICRTVSADARVALESDGVAVLDDDDLIEELGRWDYHKQNLAVQGMLHYLANIEENPDAVQRLLRFLEDIDPNNRALAHLIE
jgi:hypothetical protein